MPEPNTDGVFSVPIEAGELRLRTAGDVVDELQPVRGNRPVRLDADPIALRLQRGDQLRHLLLNRRLAARQDHALRPVLSELRQNLVKRGGESLLHIGIAPRALQVATGKADSKFKDAGKLGTILGAIAGGDTETAMKEIGDAIGNAVPEIGLATKAAGYVGAKVNETFTNWKSNQIEDLYQKFKNGHEDMSGRHP